MATATMVPSKGGTGKAAADKCCEFFEESRYQATKVLVETDQEESIKYLVRDIVNLREERRTLVEETPVGSKGGNGILERAVQEIKGRITKMFLSFQ